MSDLQVPEIERFSVRLDHPHTAATWTLKLSATGSMVRFSDHTQVVTQLQDRIGELEGKRDALFGLAVENGKGFSRERCRAEEAETQLAECKSALRDITYCKAKGIPKYVTAIARAALTTTKGKERR